MKIIFKPNMTINAMTPDLLRIERIEKIPPSEFADEIVRKSNVSLSTFKLRNLLGSILFNYAPNLDRYMRRLVDLDIKMDLFNQLYYYRAIKR